MKRPGPVNRDLFGKPPPRPKDGTPVTVPLLFVQDTADAWLLRASRGAGAKWAPKREVSRGEGLAENLFTMPRWIAAERGWL